MSQVIIVGGGPVGLGLAIDLALFGVTSTVLERSTTLHAIPKGQNLTQRVGEMLRRWGVTDAVRAASPIPPDFGNGGLVAYGTLLGDYHYDWFQRAKVGAYYFARNARLPQYRLEQVLRDRAARLDQITLITGATVRSATENAEGVSVTYDTMDGEKTLAADYLVGCDGARSAIRKSLGIASDTDHEGPRMALLMFRSHALHDLLKRYPGKTIFNVMHPAMDGYWQFLGRVDLDGGWFFHAPVPADTTIDTFDFAQLLYDMVGAKFSLDFEHIGFWDLRITQADTYRKGRGFIAGDACHSHPPYGGYGINLGLEDASNLSWKLAAVLNGWAGDALLDTYTEERHPVFRATNTDFIARMIADFRDFTTEFSPDTDPAAFATAWERRATAGDSDVTEYVPHYSGSSIVAGTPGAQSGARGTHQMAARPGYHLAPQPLPDGSDLWDQMGGGFTLLDVSATGQTAARFDAAARTLGLPLRVAHHPSAALVTAYKTEAMLIRPDLFLAWVASDATEDAEAVLRSAIGRHG